MCFGVIERRVVAYDELGHAIVAMALPGQDPAHISRSSRTGSARSAIQSGAATGDEEAPEQNLDRFANGRS
jgi:ATP-dependent Zn protease